MEPRLYFKPTNIRWSIKDKPCAEP